MTFWKDLQPAPQSELVEAVSAVRSSGGHGGFVCRPGWGTRGGHASAGRAGSLRSVFQGQEHVLHRAGSWSDWGAGWRMLGAGLPRTGYGVLGGGDSCTVSWSMGQRVGVLASLGLPAAVIFRAAPVIGTHSPGLRKPEGPPFPGPVGVAPEAWLGVLSPAGGGPPHAARSDVWRAGSLPGLGLVTSPRCLMARPGHHGLLAFWGPPQESGSLRGTFPHT